MFRVLVPVAVLAINVIVVREVRRRASSDAASILGIQHHQSTSSNSAVPSVMLVTTSLIYVLLHGVWSFIHLAYWIRQKTVVTIDFYRVAIHLGNLIYVYNFYVYLITGRQFRSELHKLFCGCRSSSSAAAAVTNDNVRVARRGQADTAVWKFMHWGAADIYQTKQLEIPLTSSAICISQQSLDDWTTEHRPNIYSQTSSLTEWDTRQNSDTLLFIRWIFIKMFVVKFKIKLDLGLLQHLFYAWVRSRWGIRRTMAHPKIWLGWP